MTLWKCFYHLIWATVQRVPTLVDERESIFRGVSLGVCRELNVLVHETGMVADHVHMVVSIPPKHAVADVVRRVKGATSIKLKEASSDLERLWTGWQSEYGVLTFSERSLDDVVAYVRNQKDHHITGSLRPAFEAIDRRD